MSNNDPHESKVEQPEPNVGENRREDGQLSDSEVDRVSGGATVSSAPPKLGPAGVSILPNEGGN